MEMVQFFQNALDPCVLEDPDEIRRDFMGQEIRWAGAKGKFR
jgi:hypothetical protein